MGLVARLDQLAGYANSLAVAPNAALQHAVDVQFGSNFSNGFLCCLVLNGGGARDHSQPLGVELSEMGDHFLGQSAGKIFLLDTATQVLEGKYEEHFLYRRRSRFRGLDHRGDETIATPGEGFEEPGTPRGVSQKIAQLVDGGVQPVVVTDNPAGP